MAVWSIHVGRITMAGVVTTFADKATNGLSGVVQGPDKAMWFTGGGIAHSARPGVITGANDRYASGSITVGPDGALWFIEGNKINVDQYVARAPIPR